MSGLFSAAKAAEALASLNATNQTETAVETISLEQAAFTLNLAYQQELASDRVDILEATAAASPNKPESEAAVIAAQGQYTEDEASAEKNQAGINLTMNTLQVEEQEYGANPENAFLSAQDAQGVQFTEIQLLQRGVS